MKRIFCGLLILSLTVAGLGAWPHALSALAQSEGLHFTLMHTNDEHSAL